jgi:fatty-acid desaturase
MNISFNSKIRALQLLNLVTSILGFAWAFLNSHHFYLWVSLGAFLVFGILGANIGMHRLFAHRSFEPRWGVEPILALLSVLTTMGTTLGWVGLHRFHHSHSDTEKDPHSPEVVGNLCAWVGLWQPVIVEPRFVSDLMRSQLHRWLHRNYFLVILVYVGALAVIDLRLPLFAYCVPASFCLQGSSAVTVFCHRWGYRRYTTTDHSYNNWLAWILSLGEGWHNSHHHNSSSYRQGESIWELDPSAWLIRSVLSKSVRG